MPRRRPPRRHDVHTRDSRYNVSQYERGSGIYAEPQIKDPADIIAEQLREMNPFYIARYNIKHLIKVDENTLRLDVRGRGKNIRKVDIKYNRPLDVYDVTAYELKRDASVWKIYETDGVYWDMLPDILDRIVLNGEKMKKPVRMM
jgi:hypothetical protein